ncbi:hypothetical protein OG266_39240 [Streptomyces sp. NBC_00554]|uniref:hypothetical protein n=1 Tax=Streptomyces sp. NBC_00554 TaxID=2903661 RepID=UPI00352D603E|nr:hypothetical protein OG266_39240 [Streptomyces sp. NBC_00554]
MLRITDVRTGEPTDAVRARRALARVRVHVPTADTSALRVLLVADVLARALEIGGTPAVTAADPPEELRVRADALGIRRAEAGTAGAGPTLHVVTEGDPALDDTGPDDIRIEVAPVTGTADPALLRMILLATPRREPVDLATADLEGARETLARWRKAVATWATRPSKPVPEAVRQELRAAWEDDLDVPAVLEVLRRVESDEGIPDGARFETYAYADRLLGLELTRDIGSVR